MKEFARAAVLAFALASLVSISVAAGPAQATHPRPGGGTPFRVPLVPAFEQCTSPNTTHTAPLALPSCTPPVTEGTLTAMGNGGAGTGFVKLEVFCTDAVSPPCNPSNGTDTEDVRVTVSLRDVRCLVTSVFCSAVGADYIGPVAVTSQLRLTDHNSGATVNDPPCANGAGSPPCTTATMNDRTYGVQANCTDNGGPNGANCNLASTLDTMIPGTVKELQRAVWQLPGAIWSGGTVGYQVADAGADNTLVLPGFPFFCPPDCGTGDEQPIARQGLFLP
jgi:hypothetical protein